MSARVAWWTARTAPDRGNPGDDEGPSGAAAMERAAFLDALFDSDTLNDGAAQSAVDAIGSGYGSSTEDAIVDHVIRELLAAQDALRVAGLK